MEQWNRATALHALNVICMSSSIVLQWDSTYTCKIKCLQGQALKENKSCYWGVPCSEPCTESVMQMYFAGWAISSDLSAPQIRSSCGNFP